MNNSTATLSPLGYLSDVDDIAGVKSVEIETQDGGRYWRPLDDVIVLDGLVYEHPIATLFHHITD